MADIEETRAIVSAGETYEGKVIPTRRAELDRPVTIHENATVTEGVYGQDITISKGVTVDGPVMAKESVEFTGGTVTADVGTDGKVIGERGTIHGTITGTKVTLEDCIVYGNVVGQDVVLEDCLLLGVIVGERTTELHDTICYTFKSFGEGVFKQTKIVLPQAIADGSVTLNSHIPVLSIPDKLLDDEREVSARLTRHDLAEHDGTQYLTLAPRLLQLSAVRERIKAIEDLFTGVVVSLKARDDGDQPGYDREWLEKELGELGE